MKIIHKIILGYAAVILLLMGIGYYSLSAGKEYLLAEAAQNSSMIARSMLQKMTQGLQVRLDQLLWHGKSARLQNALLASNARFAAHGSEKSLAAGPDRQEARTPAIAPGLLGQEAIDPDLSSDLANNLLSFFELLHGYQYFSSIQLINRFGVIIATAGTAPAALRDTDGWWQAARQEGQHLSGLCAEATSQTQGVGVAVRIDDSNGKFAGIIKGFIPLSSLIRSMDLLSREFQSTHIKILSPDGTVFFSSKAIPLGKNEAQEPYFQNLHGEAGYFLYRNHPDKEKLLTYHRTDSMLNSRDLNLLTIVTHNTAELLSKSRNLETRIIAACLIALLLASLLAVVTAKTLSNPIADLNQAAQELARGNFAKRIHNNSLDETGSLAKAFNSMAENLAASHKKLIAQIEERKRIEKIIVSQNRELIATAGILAQRNAELDEFTYVASHDLQEPLRKLTAFSSLLAKDLGHELPENARKDLFYITDAATRMQTLLQDLLNLSRSGRKELTITEVPLDQCVDGALSALSLKIEETGVEIRREPLPVVQGDKTLLTQLYQNLIGNALKFVAPGRKPEIEITVEQQADRIVYGVRDNGIGIPSQYAEQIFQPFKRLHGRGEHEGSGIGLSICRKVVERHGGEIWVESEPGAGAHFRFTLTPSADAA